MVASLCGLAVAILTQPIVGRDVRLAKGIVAEEPWRLVETVVVSGCPDDLDARVLVALDPLARTPTDSWVIDTGRRGRWLVDGTAWTYVAISPSGAVAVFADADRRHFALGRGTDPRRGSIGAVHRWARSRVERVAPPPASNAPRAA